MRARSGSVVTMETLEEAMAKLKAAQTVQDMALINYLSYIGSSQLEFVDEKKEREKEIEQEELRRRLAEKKGQPLPTRRGRSPRKPHELSPRKRPRDAPPSPTKQNLQRLKAERGMTGGEEEQTRKRIDRPLSPERLEQINESFRESDRLRQEARAIMNSFTSQMNNAKQYFGNTKKGSRAGGDDDIPTYKSKRASQMTSNQTNVVNQQTTSIQYNSQTTESVKRFSYVDVG